MGYTPYYTTAIWFGFDKPGNSLGLSLTGATLAGPIWGDFMREIHQGLPYRDFIKPSSGIMEVTVCAKSGLLRTAACNEGSVTLPFLDKTQPVQYCDLHGENRRRPSETYLPTNNLTIGGVLDTESLTGDLRMPVLSLDLSAGAGGSFDRPVQDVPDGAADDFTLPPPYYEPEPPAYNPLLE